MITVNLFMCSSSSSFLALGRTHSNGRQTHDQHYCFTHSLVTHQDREPCSAPSSASGTFDSSIFENHLTTSAILGKVMWVTSAPVNWAKSESFTKHITPEVKFMIYILMLF